MNQELAKRLHSDPHLEDCDPNMMLTIFQDSGFEIMVEDVVVCASREKVPLRLA